MQFVSIARRRSRFRLHDWQSYPECVAGEPDSAIIGDPDTIATLPAGLAGAFRKTAANEPLDRHPARLDISTSYCLRFHTR
jgi:hypothetical protein